MGLVQQSPHGTVRPCCLQGSNLRNPWLVPLAGAAPNNAFGAALASLGNVGGGAGPDFVVGEPGFTSAGQAGRGAATVFDGQTGSALWTLPGITAADAAGAWVASAGDVDGGGMDDVLVGAPSAVRQGFIVRGQVLVFSGETGLLMGTIAGRGVCCGDRLGRALSRLGRLPNATTDAFLVGNEVGQLVSAYALVNGTLTAAWTATSASAQFGWSVAGLDDLDGDGVNDFAVGIPASFVVELRSGADGSLLGGSVTSTLDGTLVAGRFGESLANVGDVDGRGKADLLVGAPQARGGIGQAILFSGETQSALAIFSGEQPGDAFGSAVAGGADLTGDGKADWIIGAPGARAGAGIAVAYAFDCNLPFGVSCHGIGCTTGSGGPANIGLPAGEPYVGKASFEVGIGNGYGAAPAVLLLGPLLPSPINLCFIGYCSCDVHVDPWVMVAAPPLSSMRRTNGPGSGVGLLRLPVPNDSNLGGLAVAVQWAAFAPFLLSPSLRVTIAAVPRTCP
jgi:hypothetical protein